MLRELDAGGHGLFLTGNYRTIYYLTGYLGQPESPVAFLLQPDGKSALVSPPQGEFAADEIVPIETYSITRSITHPMQDLASIVRDLLRKFDTGHPAVERSGTAGLLESLVNEPADATNTILKLRKRKHPDEIAEVQASLKLCAAAYDAARAILAPGLTELDVYQAMYGAVIHAAGTAVPFPGDFACGVRAIRGGGPPTLRRVQNGDLYVLDLFPAPALYFGDTCRTFAVSTPTDTQFRAWEIVREAMQLAESTVRPGLPARDLYWTVKQFLDAQEISEGSFWHHAGHGIGHHGQESPRLIPGSDDVLEVGDLFTLEPGMYTPALSGGIRLEDNYVLTDAGLVNLFDYPMDL